MAKKQVKTVAQVVVSNLTLTQAQAIVAQACESMDLVVTADAVHDVLASGTVTNGRTLHAWRAGADVRLADAVVKAGHVMRKAASAFGEQLPLVRVGDVERAESDAEFFVRVGLGAWKAGFTGMVRCKGSWTPAKAESVSTF